MENLLWIDGGHRQDATADTLTKTPTRMRDGLMNGYCEIPQSEPKIPAIKKSESSWENICPPQEMHVIHQVEDGALVLETVVH